MKEIVVKTQAELDAALGQDYAYIYIDGGTTYERLIVSKRDSAHVVAWGSAHVEAWDSAHVVAWDSAHVVARGSAAVHAKSDYSKVDLFSFAVCIAVAAAKINKKSKTATIITPKPPNGVGGWLESQAIKPASEVILYKRVSSDLKTQEGTANETLWAIGATLDLGEKWSPKERECGGGKFHACSKPYFCDEFRSNAGDRYVAIKIAKKDLYAWPNASYPHKIAFKKGTVLYECDRFGKELSSPADLEGR